MARLWIILAIFTALMVLVAYLAHVYLPEAKRVPMQWSLRGQVNWSAPRAIGLAFYPVLGFAFMFAYIMLMKYVGPRQGQENLVVPIMVFSGCILVIIQVISAIMAFRSLRNE